MQAKGCSRYNVSLRNIQGDCIVIDVGAFTEEQKKLLAHVVGDFDNTTATGTLLYIMEKLLCTLKPDWTQEELANSDNLKAQIDACMAALSYLKIHQVAKDN